MHLRFELAHCNAVVRKFNRRIFRTGTRSDWPSNRRDWKWINKLAPANSRATACEILARARERSFGKTLRTLWPVRRLEEKLVLSVAIESDPLKRHIVRNFPIKRDAGKRWNRLPASVEERFVYCFSPVSAFRRRVPLLRILVKSNIWLIELAMASNDPAPMRCPPSQLSSMKWITEV